MPIMDKININYMILFFIYMSNRPNGRACTDG